MSQPLYPTPHILATPDDIAPTVLMPGDPLRSEFVARNFLTSPVLFNDVRGVKGYTGVYRGKRVSVMASGMGMPSMGIYSYELFNIFGVRHILRIGSAGAMQEELKIRDIILALGACTDSSYASQFRLPGTVAPVASYRLLKKAEEAARKRGVVPHIGSVLSSDVFYQDDPGASLAWKKMGVLAVEMETAALYLNAARSGKEALTILTVSDHLLRDEATDAAERERSFTDMMEIALDTAVSL